MGLRKKNKKLSYTRCKEVIFSRLREFLPNDFVFGMHSLRSGGVSAAANSGVSSNALKKHGRWRSDAVNRYIKESISGVVYFDPSNT